MSDSAAVEVRGLSKHFGGEPALVDVDLTVRSGEVHGLVGQNGSGKSTLIKILGGYHVPDAGTVTVFGERLSLPVRSMRRHGIAIIYQDLGLVNSMTVTENMGVEDGYGSRSFRPVNWRRAREETAAALESFGHNIDPDCLLEALHPADHAIVAIARAIRQLDRDSAEQIFVLDEPTAYLGPAEAQRVIEVMRRVAATGSSVIFVSHKLSEVLEVTDRCTVLRDGRVVDTVTTRESSARELVHLQLGRDLGDFYPPVAADARPAPRLHVHDLRAPRVGPVDLTLAEGEILGVTGLAGMGHDELTHAIGGALPRAGRIEGPQGEQLPPGVPEALARGIVLVPADRKEAGLWLNATARENLTLPSISRGFPLRPINGRVERAQALNAMERVRVRPLDPEMPIEKLSGGNQQKVLIAKWLRESPEVLLLQEPTQGVDAGARRDILALVATAAEGGTGVIVCSTDYDQLAHVCHRVVVLRDGQIVSELVYPFTERDIVLACQSYGKS